MSYRTPKETVVGEVTPQTGLAARRCPRKLGTLTISRDKDDTVLAQSRHFNVNAVYSIADTFRPRYKICSAVGPLCPRSWLCDHEVYKARMNISQIQALPVYTHSLLARGEDTM